MTATKKRQTPGKPDDERRLYGDPQHEDDADADPERLYGTPQHESGAATIEVTDLWLDCLAFRKSVEERAQ